MRLKYFLCGFFALWGFQANGQVTSTVDFGDWVKVCPPSQSQSDSVKCHLSQVSRKSDADVALLVASVTRQSNGDFTLILAVPLGINLPRGLTWQVDQDRERHLVFNTCTLEGCYAAVSLTQDIYRDLRRGLTLNLTFHDGGDRAVFVPISLLGFSAGTAAIAQSSSKKR